MCNIQCDLCEDYKTCEVAKICLNNDSNLWVKYINWLWTHDRPDSQKSFNEKLKEFFEDPNKNI